METSIKEFDRLLAWGARKGIITGKFLEGFQNALRSLVDGYNQKDALMLEQEKSIQKAIARIDKLKIILRLCGVTEKALSQLLSFDKDFLESRPYTIQDNADFLNLIRNLSADKTREISDISKIGQYAGAFEKVKNPQDKRFLNFRDDILINEPHLAKYITEIENGKMPDLEIARRELHHYYLNN